MRNVISMPVSVSFVSIVNVCEDKFNSKLKQFSSELQLVIRHFTIMAGLFLFSDIHLAKVMCLSV